MSSHIEVAREGRVMTITMNRPEVKNALTLSMYEQMTAALTEARDDAQVRAVQTFFDALAEQHPVLPLPMAPETPAANDGLARASA